MVSNAYGTSITNSRILLQSSVGRRRAAELQERLLLDDDIVLFILTYLGLCEANCGG